MRERIDAFVARVNWPRVAVIAAGVAAAAIAVRVVGPRRIARTVSTLGVAHFAEQNADRLTELAKDFATRWWPRVYAGTASVIRKPAALIGRG